MKSLSDKLADSVRAAKGAAADAPKSAPVRTAARVSRGAAPEPAAAQPAPTASARNALADGFALPRPSAGERFPQRVWPD